MDIIGRTENLIAVCGLVMLIINGFMTIKAIRRRLPKKTIAVADIVVSIWMMHLWDKALENASTGVTYWIVHVEYFFLCMIGIVTLAIAVMAGKENW